jgi:L-threonylcarbamoyladenylate synthase
VNKVLTVNVHDPEEAVLQTAAHVIREGGVLVYPTETLYGIGADALRAAAVEKVQRVKRRKDSRPILVLVHSQEMLTQLVRNIPAVAHSLMRKFWPGPLTIVFEARTGLPNALTLGSGTIGIRIPSSVFCLALLRRCNLPLTSTSANISGEQPPRTIPEIQQALPEGIDLFLDAGTLPESKPSTIVSVASPVPQLIREGLISFDSLRTVVPVIER